MDKLSFYDYKCVRNRDLKKQKTSYMKYEADGFIVCKR